MKLKQFIEGLTILSRYFDGEDGYHIGAEHDIIYVYETARPVEDTDLKRLVELGWFQPEAIHDRAAFRVDQYDPAESWAAYP